jgi:hypothetical protein
MSVVEWVRETRRAQGLPPVVEDPAVLARIALLMHADGAAHLPPSGISKTQVKQ